MHGRGGGLFFGAGKFVAMGNTAKRPPLPFQMWAQKAVGVWVGKVGVFVFRGKSDVVIAD